MKIAPRLSTIVGIYLFIGLKVLIALKGALPCKNQVYRLHEPVSRVCEDTRREEMARFPVITSILVQTRLTISEKISFRYTILDRNLLKNYP